MKNSSSSSSVCCSTSSSLCNRLSGNKVTGTLKHETCNKRTCGKQLSYVEIPASARLRRVVQRADGTMIYNNFLNCYPDAPWNRLPCLEPGCTNTVQFVWNVCNTCLKESYGLEVAQSRALPGSLHEPSFGLFLTCRNFQEVALLSTKFVKTLQNNRKENTPWLPVPMFPWTVTLADQPNVSTLVTRHVQNLFGEATNTRAVAFGISAKQQRGSSETIHQDVLEYSGNKYCSAGMWANDARHLCRHTAAVPCIGQTGQEIALEQSLKMHLHGHTLADQSLRLNFSVKVTPSDELFLPYTTTPKKFATFLAQAETLSADTILVLNEQDWQTELHRKLTAHKETRLKARNEPPTTPCACGQCAKTMQRTLTLQKRFPPPASGSIHTATATATATVATQQGKAPKHVSVVRGQLRTQPPYPRRRPHRYAAGVSEDGGANGANSANGGGEGVRPTTTTIKTNTKATSSSKALTTLLTTQQVPIPVRKSRRVTAAPLTLSDESQQYMIWKRIIESKAAATRFSTPDIGKHRRTGAPTPTTTRAVVEESPPATPMVIIPHGKSPKRPQVVGQIRTQPPYSTRRCHRYFPFSSGNGGSDGGAEEVHPAITTKTKPTSSKALNFSNSTTRQARFFTPVNTDEHRRAVSPTLPGTVVGQTQTQEPPYSMMMHGKSSEGEIIRPTFTTNTTTQQAPVPVRRSQRVTAVPLTLSDESQQDIIWKRIVEANAAEARFATPPDTGKQKQQ
jgi:hypothetical protein